MASSRAALRESGNARYVLTGVVEPGAIDLAGAAIGIVRSRSATGLPYVFNTVERHPLGSQAFIPLAFHPANTKFAHLPGPDLVAKLKVVALSRLMLDNIPHIKAYWIMLGVGTAVNLAATLLALIAAISVVSLPRSCGRSCCHSTGHSPSRARRTTNPIQRCLNRLLKFTTNLRR